MGKSQISFIFLLLYAVQYLTAEKCIYIRTGKAKYSEQIDCNKTRICNKEFAIVTLMTPPYSDANILTDIIEICCGSCLRHIQTIDLALNNETIEVLMGEIRHFADFVFPFLGDQSTTTLYGWHFIPFFSVPSFFYITRNEENILEEVILSALELYPLVIICITLAIIAGFIIWFFETWFNELEFPRPFLKGWFEGFWWSFISMTTVGYGDKTPKKAGSRIFSVLWIMIGIALFNIVTGEITSILVKANNPPLPSVRGKKVGVLKYRQADKSYVTKNGGLIYHVKDSPKSDENNFYEETFDLIADLRDKKIDGIIFDKSTMMYLLSYFRMKENLRNKTRIIEAAHYLLTKTLRTEKSYEGDKMSYGIIAKNKTEYDFFSSAILDNRLSLMSSMEERWNVKDESVASKAHLFNPTGYYFVNGMKVIAGIIGFIMLFGIFFEISRRDIRIFHSNNVPKYEMDQKR